MAKSLVEQLSVPGKAVDDQDLISQIINGLNPTYNSFVTSFNFASREKKDFPFDDFQAELLSYESMLENQQYSYTIVKPHFAMIAS